MRHRRLAFIALAFCLLISPAGVAATPDTIEVRVEPRATLVDGAVEVTIRVRCDPFGEHFESNITITQDDQHIFAQRGLPVLHCDGRWHEATVLATPFEGTFHSGRAYASAYVSRLDPITGEVRQGQHARTIHVRTSA